MKKHGVAPTVWQVAKAIRVLNWFEEQAQGVANRVNLRKSADHLNGGLAVVKEASRMVALRRSQKWRAENRERVNERQQKYNANKKAAQLKGTT